MTSTAPAVRYIVHPSVGSAREEAATALSVACGESNVIACPFASPESALFWDIYAVAARAVSSSKPPPVPELALAATCTISVGALNFPTIVLPGGSFVDDNDPRSIASLCATITASPRFVAAAAKAAPVFTVAISAVPLPDCSKESPGTASSSSFELASAENKSSASILYSEELRDASLTDRCLYAAATAALALKKVRWARRGPEVLDTYGFRSAYGADIPLRTLMQMTETLTDTYLLWIERLFSEAADGATSVLMENGLIVSLTLPPPPTEGIVGLHERIFSLFLWQM